MDKHLLTSDAMMTIIRTLIGHMEVEISQAESPVEAYARTQEIIVMALACIQDPDVREAAQGGVDELPIDHEKFRQLLGADENDANIYKFFDECYASVYGKYSKAAFHEADHVISETSRELLRIYYKARNPSEG